MPLPPPPQKRAALVSPDAFDAKSNKNKAPAAVRKPTSSRGSAAADEPNFSRERAAPAPVSFLSTEPAPTVKAQTKPASKAAPRPAAKSAAKNKIRQPAERLFVLDTNVLLHDPTSLFRFEEHDIYLPMIVLEELDGHKKGMTEVARNARQVSRTLDQLAAGEGDIAHGLPLSTLGHRTATGRLFFQTVPLSGDLPAALPQGKADNQILGVVAALQAMVSGKNSFTTATEAVLVSKDINMRIKARALGLNAEDYFNDQVIEDTDVLYSGQLALPADFWETHSTNLESWQEGVHTYYRVQGTLPMQMVLNQYVYFDHPDALAFHGQVVEIDTNNRTATLRSLIDYSNPKHGVWGIGARNREQNFALNVLMDTEIDFVTLLGPAGTGKTLLTIAAALQQTLEMGRFAEVIITRATIAVGEDIGFLPGTEEEKMTPWMGALQDNLEILIKGDANAGDWQRAATGELIKNKVKIKAMSFMRGRTFVNKLLIIDEAQNLTPKQMKTLITRAGPGTKVVCMGNLAQIDTPYLTEGSSGLAYVVEHFKNWAHGAHITLMRGERSRLADFANGAL